MGQVLNYTSCKNVNLLSTFLMIVAGEWPNKNSLVILKMVKMDPAI